MNITHGVLGIALCAVAATSSLSVAHTLSEAPQSNSPHDSIVVLHNSFQNNVTTRVRRIVRTQKTLDSLWRLAAPGEGAAPRVAFDRYDVIVAALGDKPTTHYEVRVVNVEVLASEEVVSIETTAPPVQCITGDMVTQPLTIVRFPRPATGAARNNVRFVDLPVRKVCVRP